MPVSAPGKSSWPYISSTDSWPNVLAKEAQPLSRGKGMGLTLTQGPP